MAVDLFNAWRNNISSNVLGNKKLDYVGSMVQIFQNSVVYFKKIHKYMHLKKNNITAYVFIYMLVFLYHSW